MENVRSPQLLLLEDDGVSAAFLVQVLAALPARIDHASRLAEARELARAGHDLWLFDARLPDGHGADLLRELRASGLSTPAMALTAEDNPVALDELRAAGFRQVLSKPITAADLTVVVRAQLTTAEHGAHAWDDAIALSALGGSEEAVRALRRLFLQELPGQERQVDEACARGDREELRELLHRLKASCAFVGASALLSAVRELSARPGDAASLASFRARAQALIETA